MLFVFTAQRIPAMLIISIIYTLVDLNEWERMKSGHRCLCVEAVLFVDHFGQNKNACVYNTEFRFEYTGFAIADSETLVSALVCILIGRIWL